MISFGKQQAYHVALVFGRGALLATLACLSVIEWSPHANAESANCRHLTFRWVKLGFRYLDFDEIKSEPAAYGNAPFLTDPDITDTEVETDKQGNYIRIWFGATSAAILKRETTDHSPRQVIVMIGDELIVAPMVTRAVSYKINLYAGGRDSLAQLRPLAARLWDAGRSCHGKPFGLVTGS